MPEPAVYGSCPAHRTQRENLLRKRSRSLSLSRSLYPLPFVHRVRKPVKALP